eukprot:SAG11_NODE_18461_length_490_cov_1.109974_1_plen_133_part_01
MQQHSTDLTGMEVCRGPGRERPADTRRKSTQAGLGLTITPAFRPVSQLIPSLRCCPRLTLVRVCSEIAPQYGITTSQVTIGRPQPDALLNKLLESKKKLVAERISAVQELETSRAKQKVAECLLSFELLNALF